MALSPNYGWSEPDNTSLVKDGALAMRTLGDAIDTSVWNVGYGQAAKNKIINGDFAINQRSFTSNTADNTFNFDRWLASNSGTSGTQTITPQNFTPGTAPVAGYEGKQFLQSVTASGADVNTVALVQQKIEDVRTFAGQTVTVSFWAKANSGTPKIGVSFRQAFGSGGSGAVTGTGIATTISTSWARYSVTYSVPSISGKTVGTSSSLGLELWLSSGSDSATRSGSVGLQNNTFQIWGVQVEYGSTATPFQTATGTIQGELAACQRYYYRSTSSAGSQTATGISGITSSTTNLVGYFNPPVPMRVTPTAVDFSSIGTQTTSSGLTAISAVALVNESTSNSVSLNLTSSGFLANLFGLVRGTTGTGYIGLSAEL